MKLPTEPTPNFAQDEAFDWALFAGFYLYRPISPDIGLGQSEYPEQDPEYDLQPMFERYLNQIPEIIDHCQARRLAARSLEESPDDLAEETVWLALALHVFFAGLVVGAACVQTKYLSTQPQYIAESSRSKILYLPVPGLQLQTIIDTETYESNIADARPIRDPSGALILPACMPLDWLETRNGTTDLVGIAAMGAFIGADVSCRSVGGVDMPEIIDADVGYAVETLMHTLNSHFRLS